MPAATCLFERRCASPAVDALWVEGERQEHTSALKAETALLEHPGRTLDMDATWRKPNVSLRSEPKREACPTPTSNSVCCALPISQSSTRFRSHRRDT